MVLRAKGLCWSGRCEAAAGAGEAVTVEIEGEDKPALIAEWISQFFV